MGEISQDSKDEDDEVFGMSMSIGGQNINIAQNKGHGPTEERLTPDTIKGMNGDEDLKLKMVVGGNNVRVPQQHQQQVVSDNHVATNQQEDDEDLGITITVDGQKMNFGQTSEPSDPVIKGQQDLGLNMNVMGDNVRVSQY